ncbi:MAG: hypothetical protein JWP29_3454, partial [Rhodoferax sp.]|nr:hypothetical protein [Rhodoferax sp.]
MHRLVFGDLGVLVVGVVNGYEALGHGVSCRGCGACDKI